MDQHPVPRNITGFEFQLIGMMTLKQFGYLAGGFVVAFILYKAPLSIFSLPLAIVAALIGVAFAFFPVQERPLEIWVTNFIRSMWAPTQYVWVKENVVPSYFSVRSGGAFQTKEVDKTTLEKQKEARDKLNHYLQTVTVDTQDGLDKQEHQTLTQVKGLFSTQPPVVQQSDHQATPTSPRHTTVSLPVGVVAGLVTTGSGALPGMLVHLNDTTGKTIRLFKTNAEGKFTTAIPLPPGDYQMIIEDPSNRYSFAMIPFRVGSEGLHPWKITPKGELN